MTLSEARRDEVPRKIGLVSRLDTELDNAWQERRWVDFVRAWLSAVVVATVAGFLASLIMVGGYDLVLSLVFGAGKGWSASLGICAGIAAMACGTMILFTLPVMLLKEGQGTTRT